jgi:hypothetical protein
MAFAFDCSAVRAKLPHPMLFRREADRGMLNRKNLIIKLVAKMGRQ